MSNPTLRDGWYYLRLRVPQDIVGTFACTRAGKPRQEVWEPLHTRGHAEAKRRLAAAMVTVAERFAAHRRERNIPCEPAPSGRAPIAISSAGEPFYSTQDALTAFTESLDCIEVRLRNLTTMDVAADPDAFWRGEIIPLAPGLAREVGITAALAACYRAQMQRRLSLLQDELEIGEFASVEAGLGQAFQKWPDDIRFLILCARAQIEYMESRLRRPGSVVYSLSVDEQATPAQCEIPLLTAAAARWRPVKVREGWKEGGNALRLLDTATKLLIEVCGDKPMNTYSKADVADFKDVLYRLPRHRSKLSATKHLNAKEAAALGLPPIHLKTANDYIGPIVDLFDWAKASLDGVENNPFDGATFTVRSNQRDGRDSFSPDELRAIFAGLKRADDAKFWAPILALYTGCRSNELLKLKTTDVRREEGTGIWYLDINEDPHSDPSIHHTLKRSSNRRRIPLHADLVPLGFLDFVARCKGERLFAELKANRFGKFSDAFGKWFARFLGEIGVKRPKIDFHSFRHCFGDACDGHMPDDIIKRLRGDVRGGMLDRYGSGRTELQVLAEHVSKMRLPKGVDLSHLVPTRQAAE